MKKALFMLIGSTIILGGCSSGIRFFVCPYEFSTEMKSESDIGQRREILVGLDYRVLVVHIDENGEIVPIQHYRPEHTFGNRTHPLEVSYEKPLTLTALVIINEVQKPMGIAIKKVSDIDWRIYWLKDADIKELRNNGVVYLPPYNRLSLIKNER